MMSVPGNRSGRIIMLTLGEAAALLGLSRWDYAARLRGEGFVQWTDPRTGDDER